MSLRSLLPKPRSINGSKELQDEAFESFTEEFSSNGDFDGLARMGEISKAFPESLRRQMDDLSRHMRVSQTATELKVERDLADFDPADVRTSIADGMLVIEGEHKVLGDTNPFGRQGAQHSNSRFVQKVKLPFDATSDDILRKCENGVLKIIVRKPDT